MRIPEFLPLFAWLLLPALGLGMAALAFVPAAPSWPFWRRGIALVVLSAILGMLFVVATPSSWNQYLGVQEVELAGLRTMWAPFSLVAVALALLLVVACSRVRSRSEL